ncbi:MAG: hypothetical protein ACKOHG_15405, partial [Planctomycetia bacterium]
MPLIIRGPGVAANSWCHVPVVGYDLLPTCCEWAGLPIAVIPPGVEGGSIVSLVAHEGRGEVKRSREDLVFHFPHYQGDDGPHSAIRIGSLKLLRFYEDDRVMLFGLVKDAGWHRHRDEARQSDRDQSPPPAASRFILTADAKPKRPAAVDIARAFEPFVDTKAISCRSDERSFYVESRGIPDHPLMVGIRA